jgi:hypothetical protein
MISSSAAWDTMPWQEFVLFWCITEALIKKIQVEVKLSVSVFREKKRCLG